MVVCPVTSRVIGRVDRPPDPLIGTVLERKYRIEDKLGEGGMGAVYTGEHLMMKRRVAIKTLLSQFTANPNAVQRFQREAQAASAMGHPNIITIHDLGQTPDGMLYIVMEYLDGRDLGKETRELKLRGVQVMEPQRAFAIMSQVAEGLAAAHEKGVVHRDLKPDNIFLVPNRDGTDRVKLLDFGISKIRTPSPDQSRLTTDGSLLGTPYYMSPEQAQGKSDIDHRADIYAYGVILYELLTGQVPFEDENMLRVIAMHALEQPLAPRQANPRLPVEVEAVILRSMAKEPLLRFQTMAEMRDVIESLSAVVHPTETQPGPAPVAVGAGYAPTGTPSAERSGIGPGPGMTAPATPLPMSGAGPQQGAGPVLQPTSVVGAGMQGYVPGSYGGSGVMPAASPVGHITATPMAWDEGAAPRQPGGAALKVVLVAIIVVLLAGVGTGIAFLVRGSRDEPGIAQPGPGLPQPNVTVPVTQPVTPNPPPVVPPVVPVVPVQPPVGNQPQVQPPVVPAPQKVTIRFVSEPAGAGVYEGESLLGQTPYDLVADQGAAERHFMLKLTGYRDYPVAVVPERDTTSTSALRRLRREAGPSGPTKTRPPGSDPGRTGPGGLFKANPFDT